VDENQTCEMEVYYTYPVHERAGALCAWSKVNMSLVHEQLGPLQLHRSA
jgi:hypothetical protein